jgi:hypothetical protein
MLSIAAHRQTWLGSIADWCRNWTASPGSLGQLDAGEMEHVARDVALNMLELRTIAGKWPDAANLLAQRLAALQIDNLEIARAEPAALRDLERVCTLCDEKRDCRRDLGREPSNTDWRAYCRNIETLDALNTERSAMRLQHRQTKQSQR